MLAVGNVAANAPLLVIVAGKAVPLMVIEIVSPFCGKTAGVPGAEIVPKRLIEGVPAKIRLRAGQTAEGWCAVVHRDRGDRNSPLIACGRGCAVDVASRTCRSAGNVY